MVWEPEIEELERRKQFAFEMGGHERIERQRDTRRHLSMLIDAAQPILKRVAGPKPKYGVRP